MTLRNTTLRTSLIGGAMLILAACNLNQTANPLPDTGFREARFEQMQKLQAFRGCRDQALQLDTQARSRASAPAFLTSAQVLDKCVADLGPAAATVPADERMRLQAMSVVNYFRGGDIEMARRQFESFKTSWPEHDLYFAGGTSFIATAEALLGRTEEKTFGQFMALNVTDEVKTEMRRLNHWKNK
ncbi:MAG: hypothetical protein ACPGRZ_16880 [Alphaproteobacteria bacterium]